jgi:hypothetical protein
LLLWSAACFLLTAGNNVTLVVDKLLTPPDLDLSLLRLTFAVMAVAVLLFGLVWNEE